MPSLRISTLLPLLILMSGCAPADNPVPTLQIDQSRVTTSGVSAGAHMAHQLHIAYSDLFSGAGIVSGGPYNCAQNSLKTAMSLCMANTDQPLPVMEMAAYIRSAAQTGAIADTENLAGDRVWLFHGTEDTTISAEVHDTTATLYAEFIPAEQIATVSDIPAGHFFPSMDQGHGCSEMKAPFVGDCDFDAAGELLQWLYSDLVSPGSQAGSELLAVSLPGADEADLMETAYLYIPTACAEGQQACALHLVLHGCAQSADTVGTGFIEQSGYLPWAEANNIIMAFPQVAKSLMAPLNPHACWDWWGYTGDDYLTRNSKQMSVLVGWINGLSK